MLQSKVKDRKAEIFHEYREIRSEAYRAVMRAIGTPFSDRAYTIHEIASDILAEFQSNADGHIAQLDRLEMTPMSLFLCEVIAGDF